jgi:hypothetical protein
VPKWHCPSTRLTLPQASAIVSNTRSWRNAGFRYGFLELLGAPEMVVLELDLS